MAKLSLTLPFILLGTLALSACSDPDVGTDTEVKAPDAQVEAQTDVTETAAAALDIAAVNAALTAQQGRSDAEKARDAGRKSAEVLDFLGMKTGDTVFDILSSGGWYTEAISIALGPDGKVYAQNTPGNLARRDGANDKAMTARLDGDRLANVVRLDEEFTALSIPPASVDLAITALNFHDVYYLAGAEQVTGLLVIIKGTLKPGGVLGIIDHVGDSTADNQTLHRIDPALVSSLAEAAGFVVEAESTLLANPDDDHSENPFGTFRGKTDRFVLRLRNPG